MYLDVAHIDETGYKFFWVSI